MLSKILPPNFFFRQLKPKPSRTKKYLKRSLIVGTCGIIIYLADLWINDDWNTITDKFRSKISPKDREKRPKVVILGSGWAALSMLRRLHTDKFNVTVISPRNYFLFTPLLPSTTVGTLEVRSIMEPIRNFLKRSNSEEARFIEAECWKIDPILKIVSCEDNSGIKGSVCKFNVPYDHLVVAVGAQTATFGIPGVMENSVFLREIEDVSTLRNKIIDCFETAVIPNQPIEEIKRLLSIIVVGGGPAGVEYVAELNDWLRGELSQAFPEVSENLKIHLIEALPHILNMFDSTLINFVEKRFSDNPHIDLETQRAVTLVKEKSIVVKNSVDGTVHEIPYGMLLWVAGNAVRPIIADLIQRIGAENGQDNRRGLVTDKHLRVKGAENIWALGDCAMTGFPATGQVAAQQGRYLGDLFNKLSEEMFREAEKSNSGNTGEIGNTAEIGNTVDFNSALENYEFFKYINFGSFAYVGDHRAIAELDFQNKWISAGTLTYALWRSVYLSKLLSGRNRVSVFIDWWKSLLFGRDISRG